VSKRLGSAYRSGRSKHWLKVRKAELAALLSKPSQGIALNEHHVGHGDIVYQQACKLGCEGIVSKRLGSTYRSGRSRQWVKSRIRRHWLCGARRKKIGREACQGRTISKNWPRKASPIRPAQTCLRPYLGLRTVSP
jgi:ATP-dependent DNA ligase